MRYAEAQEVGDSIYKFGLAMKRRSIWFCPWF